MSVKLGRILFATDFSDYSERAREYVRYLAGLAGASISVLHVIETLHDTDPMDEELRQWYRELEKTVGERLEREVGLFRQDGLDAAGELVLGDPWRTILRFAKEPEIDLLVVGSHGIRTREGSLLLGTTSHKLAMTSPVPVLIIRPDSQPEASESYSDAAT